MSRARSAWNVSAPARSASAKLEAPTGMTMNSWKSTFVSACAPPLRMFIIGTGSTGPPARAAAGTSEARCSYSGSPAASAAARAVAIDTPSTALAPRRPRFGVPSSCRSVVVDRPLVGGLADERRGNLAVDVADGLQHALAAVAALVAVAKLQRLACAGGGAGRDGGAAERARLEHDVHFDGWIASRIKNFPGLNTTDLQGEVSKASTPSAWGRGSYQAHGSRLKVTRRHQRRASGPAFEPCTNPRTSAPRTLAPSSSSEVNIPRDSLHVSYPREGICRLRSRCRFCS